MFEPYVCHLHIMILLMFSYFVGKKNAFNPNFNWCSRWLQRNKFVHRVGTKDAKKLTKDEGERDKFLARIALLIKDHNIPPELVFFWDEYGQELVPTSKNTFAKRGSKDVVIHGLEDKRQITGTLCHNGNHELIGVQLIFKVCILHLSAIQHLSFFHFVFPPRIFIFNLILGENKSLPSQNKGTEQVPLLSLRQPLATAGIYARICNSSAGKSSTGYNQETWSPRDTDCSKVFWFFFFKKYFSIYFWF